MISYHGGELEPVESFITLPAPGDSFHYDPTWRCWMPEDPDPNINGLDSWSRRMMIVVMQWPEYQTADIETQIYVGEEINERGNMLRPPSFERDEIAELAATLESWSRNAQIRCQNNARAVAMHEQMAGDGPDSPS